MSELFMESYVPFTRPDGHTILRRALRCRWCFAATATADTNDPAHFHHERPCRAADVIDRWYREGHSAALDALVDMLDEAENRPPS